MSKSVECRCYICGEFGDGPGPLSHDHSDEVMAAYRQKMAARDDADCVARRLRYRLGDVSWAKLWRITSAETQCDYAVIRALGLLAELAEAEHQVGCADVVLKLTLCEERGELLHAHNLVADGSEIEVSPCE